MQFTDKMLKAITGAKFADTDDFLTLEKQFFREFEVPAAATVQLCAGDTAASVREKLLAVEDRTHIWIDGALTPGKHTALKHALVDVVAEVVAQLRREDLLPERSFLHYRRADGKVSPPHVHPAYLRKVIDGKISLPHLPFPVYKGGQPMVEATMLHKGDNPAELYAMAFEASNFQPIHGGPVVLSTDYGITLDPASWKHPIANMEIPAVELIIQAMKVAAGRGERFKLKTLEAVVKSLTVKRMQDLKETFGIDVPTHQHPTMALNERIADRLMEIMGTCTDPKLQKALGRLCALDGGAYFPKMDEVGNALIMAVGVMIRLHREDPALVALVDLCVRRHILVHEAAMHDGIDGECHGGFEDIKWGVWPCQPRFSHLAIAVTCLETPCDAFGRGLNAVVAARRGGCKRSREMLGLGNGEEVDPIVVDRDTVAKVIRTMFDAMED